MACEPELRDNYGNRFKYVGIIGRAFDIRTGQRIWIFHTLPRPGEFGSETWPENYLDHTGGFYFIWGLELVLGGLAKLYAVNVVSIKSCTHNKLKK